MISSPTTYHNASLGHLAVDPLDRDREVEGQLGTPLLGVGRGQDCDKLLALPMGAVLAKVVTQEVF